MNTAHKSARIAVMAISAVALTAPAALAQSEPELHNQSPRLITTQEIHAASDLGCPAVTPTPAPAPAPTLTSGGCRIHFTAPAVTEASHLSSGGTEVVRSVCDTEFDMRLDAAGEGYITHQEFTQGATGACTRRACGQVTPPTSEGRAFTAYLQEREVAGGGPREEMVIFLCTEPIEQGQQAHCEFTVPMSQVAEHRYRFVASDVSGHGTVFPHCEFSFTLDHEAVLGTAGEGQLEQNFEMRHT